MVTELSEQDLISLIQRETMESAEVIAYLGVSKQRLSDMARQGILVPVKKGIYLRRQVESRRDAQESLREKYRPYDNREGS